MMITMMMLTTTTMMIKMVMMITMMMMTVMMMTMMSMMMMMRIPKPTSGHQERIDHVCRYLSKSRNFTKIGARTPRMITRRK